MKTTGIQSEAATAAWWRMQFESCQAALAEVIAENTENVEALADVVTDYGDRCDDLDGCDCSMARAARLTAHMRAPEGDHAAHTADEGGGEEQIRRDEREGWASWLETWLSAVGPEPPTVEAILRWLRADSRPWGVSAALPSPALGAEDTGSRMKTAGPESGPADEEQADE